MSDDPTTCRSCGNTFRGYGNVCPQCGTPIAPFVLDAAGQRARASSSDVPFRELVTSAESKQDRLELLKGIGLCVFTKGGYIAVIALAVSLNMGLHAGAIWVWGWILLSSAAFPDCKAHHRARYVIVGLSLFGVGVVVRLLGL